MPTRDFAHPASEPRARKAVRIERHRLGPRLHVFDRRVHECHAGAALIAAALAVLLATPVPLLAGAGMLTVGIWLFVKDWRDLVPAWRDERAWRAGVHRRPRPLRAARRAAWLPSLTGWLTALLGVMNVASALTPDLGDRARLVRQLTPHEVPVLAHAFALSAGVVLVLLGFYLARRRRRAWWAATAVLVLAGALNLLKGLDVEEALACWSLAGILWWGRDAFCVRQRSADLKTAAKRIAAIAGSSLVTLALALLCASHWGSEPLTSSNAIAELAAPLMLTAGPIHYRDPFDWLLEGIGVVELGALVAAAYMTFRLAIPGRLPQPGMRTLARRIVEVHGRDTLSYFKLRPDHPLFFDSAQEAFAAYRIEGRVLMLSGDPVGPAHALPRLLRELCAFAEVSGLKVGVVGASEHFAELSRSAGLKSLYIGDEAIVELAGFSLEGRAIRKVRQSVTRLQKADYTAELVPVAELGPERLRALEEISERWRRGKPERGFSMAMDGLRGPHLIGTTVAVAHDGDGRPRGFLHLVPTVGGAASLSFMRRDPDTPNGLMEFLVVRAIDLLREQGVSELSLNFAAFARLLHSPSGAHERALGRLVSSGDRFFQVESLYRFNAKFGPRWQPRYLLYEPPFGLTRAGLAAMWAEGQLPKPRLPRAPARAGRA